MKLLPAVLLMSKDRHLVFIISLHRMLEENYSMSQTNKESVFTLSSSSDLYILLGFRAQDLTHAEKIEIILELERSITMANGKHIHLVWNKGSRSDLTIWSESTQEKTIPFNSIPHFFSSTKFEQHPLPNYLYQMMNEKPQFIVFHSKDYFLSMLDMPYC